MRWSTPGTLLYMGDMTNTALGCKLRSWRWPRGDLDVDLSGRTALVAGGNAGIGRSVAEALAARGATVHLVARSRERGERAQQELAAAHPAAAVHLHVVDLGRPAQVRAFAADFAASQPSLDVLVNNAAVMLGERGETADGLEAAFATNVVGFYVLTRSLLPALREGSRVVNLVSGGMYGARLDVPTVVGDLPEGQEYDGALAYAVHHRARVQLTVRWAAELRARGVAVNCTHPGWVDTPGLAGAAPMAGFYAAMRRSLRTPEQGADTAVWLACGKSAEGRSGGFYVDRAERPLHKALANTRSPEGEEERLVEVLEGYLSSGPSAGGEAAGGEAAGGEAAGQ